MPPPPPTRPFAIGIAGGSGSGKTSLARELATRLGAERCCVLDHDSYYRDLSDRPMVVRAATNFDHPDSLESALLAEHVRALRARRTIRRPVYDFSTHTRSAETVEIAPRPVVICEGVLLLSVPELRSAFDLRVYVDTPSDVRALRRLQRDIQERGRTVESVIRQYLDSVRPMHERYVAPSKRSAHLVLDWRRTVAEHTDKVLGALDARRDGEPLEVST